MSRARRIAAWSLAFVLGVALLGGSPPAAAQGSGELLRVTQIDTAQFPQVRVQVALPPALASAGEPAFTVEENGAKRPVSASAVDAAASPAAVVLVIDSSGSMAGRPLADASAAAGRFIESLGPGAQVAIVAFSDRPVVLSGFTSDRAELDRAVSALQASGETALYDAVVTAAGLVPSGGDRRSIVLLSDGGDTVSNSTFPHAMDVLRKSGAPLYAVALQSPEHNPQALATLAQGTGGSLVPVTRSDELSKLFVGIAEQIRSAWTLTYTSARPHTKDIELDISAKAGKSQASASSVFVNPEFAEAAPGSDGEALVKPVTGDPLRLFAFGVLAFASFALLSAALLLIFVKERTTLEQLRFYDQMHSEAGEGTGGVTDQVRARVVDAVGAVAGKRGLLKLVAGRLEAAGLPLRPAEYITLHVVLVVGAGVAVELLSNNLALAILVVLAATVIPMILLESAVERRRRRFEEQLPDVLSMVASSLRGGWGVGQAVSLVATEAPKPASEEFRRVDTEARLGLPLERALQSMADRMGSTDFQAVVTAIAIQREVGGNLAEVLDVVGTTIREREALRRQVHALTAEGRLSAWILIGLPFGLLAILLVTSPGYLEPLYSSLFGLSMLVIGIVMLVVGSLWLWRVTKIEV